MKKIVFITVITALMAFISCSQKKTDITDTTPFCRTEERAAFHWRKTVLFHRYKLLVWSDPRFRRTGWKP